MRLNGPPQMVGARTPEQFRRRAQAITARTKVEHEDGVFIARVEHGRWLADCPCGSGVAVHPEWPNAGCLECGRWWPVVLPSDWKVIEDVLIARPQALNRGWLIGETVEKLEAENEQRGLPIRSRTP